MHTTETMRSKRYIAVNGLYLLCVVAFLAAISYNHVLHVSHHWPLDYNETGMLVITSTILEGSSPFALESQPSRISLYPVFYNYLVAPFASVLGNTLVLHRLVAALFILACCALCYRLCRWNSVSRTDSLAAASIFYAALLYYSTPIASPNSLGLLLFLSALAIPWLRGFSTPSLAAAIAVGTLGFYTKQYFIASLGYIALYLFLAESKKRAIVFGLSALAVLVASLAPVVYTQPYFLHDTFFAVRSAARLVSTNNTLMPQFQDFAAVYYPLLAILVVAGLYRLRSTGPGAGKTAIFKPADLFDLDRPLFARKPDYVWLCCTCSVIIILVALGRNPGNHLTYLLQLISPFLLIGTFTVLSELRKWRWPFRALIVLALYNSYALLPQNFSVNEKNWQQVRKEIAAADDLYASTLLIQDVMKAGKAVYQNGHTRYFALGSDKPSQFIKPVKEERIPEIWERHVRLIESKILNQEFDLIVMDNWMQLPRSMKDSGVDPDAALRARYQLTRKLGLRLADRPGGGYYRLDIYKPR